ncbi:hypothetical protein [Mesorhizobium sp. 1M-11]|uniref:hypothetical protein n=1 Tax=Mesorhizobium sp. 1M-11 TaxID=1529006 RepID=UPI001FCD1EA9|nr:hypothetical protein [Mesorhizobium sp. 1M-11]
MPSARRLNARFGGRLAIALVGFKRRQHATAIASRVTFSNLRAFALKLVEIGVHPVDGGIERRTLADAAAEQRKTTASVARLSARLGQFVILTSNGTLIAALLASTAAFLQRSKFRSQLTADA